MSHSARKQLALVGVLALGGLLAACASALPRPSTLPVEYRDFAPAAPLETAELEELRERFEARSFTSADGSQLPYRLYGGRGACGRPLVVVLHGAGAIGSDNSRQIGAFAAGWAQPGLSAAPPVVVVPQVAERSANYATSPAQLGRTSQPGPSMPMLLELLDALVADPAVDPAHVYVVGFSMGASAALQVALARPAALAGLVLFAPVPPPPDRAGELVRLPILAVHGELDNENPYRPLRNWMELLHRAGGNARLVVYRGMGHKVPDTMLADPHWRRALLPQTSTPIIAPVEECTLAPASLRTP